MWSPRAEEIVLHLIADRPADRWGGVHADRLKALPIGGDMWADYYLRPNGEVVIVGADVDYPDVDTVVSDGQRVLRALVWGSQRYPELREILPPRTSAARDCPCQKIPVFAEGKVLCPECCGLGWL